MNTQQNKPVTLAEQERMGVRRPAPANFVPPARNPQPIQVLPPVQEIRYGLDVPQTATLHVELRTSAVDRAKGYLLETTGLCLVFALALVLGVRYWQGWPLLAAGMYLSTLILFALLWGGSYILHKLLSVEGVALLEAWRKWNVIDRVTAQRLDNFQSRMNGGE